MMNEVWKFGSSMLHPLKKPLLSSAPITMVQVAGIKFYYPKPPIDMSEWPENRKLRAVEKQPLHHTKSAKMCKMIKLMRGPESVHTELIYKGYGVKALLGGRMMFEHFEAVRKVLQKKIDKERMFAIWRIEDPWQPLAKRATGKKLGGGKGPVHHYCTPVRAERIIVELGGDLHEIEAQKILSAVASILPFSARYVSQKDLEEEKKHKVWVEKNNINPYDMKYVIKNNMWGCRSWISKYDYKWLGMYK